MNQTPITNIKYQISNNDQNSNFQTIEANNRGFWSLSFVNWILFVFCNSLFITRCAVRFCKTVAVSLSALPAG